MRIDATSFGRKTDVRNACGKLVLRAGGKMDAEELAAIYLYIVEYGAIATSRLAAVATKAMKLADVGSEDGQ